MPTFKPQYKDKNGIIQDLNIDYNSLANKPTTKSEIESIKSDINTLDKRVTSIESRLSDRIFKVDSDLAYTKNVPAGALPYASIDMIGGNVVKEPLTNRAKVLGETIKWNQLAKTMTNANWGAYNGASVSFSDGVATLTPTQKYGRLQQHFNYVANHRMLIMCDIKLSNATDSNVVTASIYGVDNIVSGMIFCQATTNWQKVIAIAYSDLSSEDNMFMVTDARDSDWGTTQIKNYIGIDLTSIYGTGNEPTDMNDTRVQQLIAYAQSHPEYDSGSVRSVELNEVEYCGENLWTWYTSKRMQIPALLLNREITFSTPNIVTFSVKVKPIEYPNNKLFFNITYADSTTETVYFYNTMSSEVTSLHLKTSKKVTKISSDYSYGGLCDIDYFVVSINSQSITFSQPISLNGLGTKDELYSQVEGNELVSYKLQRYGKVDLGTLNWYYSSSFERFSANLPEIGTNKERLNWLCSKYKADINAYYDGSRVYKIICIHSQDVYIRDDSYTDATAFKSAMSGVYLVYELATPTITEISRVPLTCDFEQVENVLFDSVLGSTELEKGVLKVQCTEKVVSVGVNIWDEEWEVGGYWTDGTKNDTVNNGIRNKTPIKVMPNQTYYIYFGNTALVGLYIHFYDKDMTKIGSSWNYQDKKNSTINVPSNCHYMNIFAPSYGTTYNHDICINVSNDAINGTYFPYFSYNFPIPSSIQALEGYGWGVNDSLYNYVDFERKKFVKKVGRVDLGTVDWIRTEYNSRYLLYASNSSQKLNTTNYLCSKYISTNDSILNIEDKCITGHGGAGSSIWVRDDSYTNATTFKSAMSGVYLYYELATPVITDISNILTDDNFIKVEPYGTLTFENTNKKAVPSKIAYLVEVE